MGIPFTQYVLPHGRKREETIERPAEIEALADKFIAAGGRYECEILTTGEVSFTAVFCDDDGDEQDVEIEICANGPAVCDAVDALVRKSISHITV
jgi:hypothetical protein